MPPRNGGKKKSKCLVRRSHVSDAYSVASKALTVAYGVKKLLNVEFKAVDILTQSSNPTSVASVSFINGLALGDNSFNRDGQQVEFKKIQVNYHISQHASATRTIVRCLCIWIHRPNAVAFAIADLLHNPTNVNSFYERGNTGNIRVLHDRTYTFTAGALQFRTGRINTKIDKKSRYVTAATGGAATDIEQGSCWLIFLSNEATNTPTCAWDSRCYFIDN